MRTKFHLTLLTSAAVAVLLFIGALVLVIASETQLNARADFTYIVQPGDSLARIAARHQTTIEALVALNQSTYPCLAANPTCLQAGWTLTVPGAPAPAVPSQYTVKRGDSLAKIAQHAGVTVRAIVDANQAQYPCLLTNPVCLQAGWVLTLPAVGAAQPAPTATSAALTSVTTTDAGEFLELRLAIAGEVNRLRSENGLPSLDWNATVAAYAQARSVDMGTRNYFSHYDPVSRVMLARQLLPRDAYPNVCENIFGQWGGDVSAVVPTAIQRWWNSAGHRKCLLKTAATVIGVGLAQDVRGGWLVTLLNVRPKN